MKKTPSKKETKKSDKERRRSEESLSDSDDGDRNLPPPPPKVKKMTTPTSGSASASAQKIATGLPAVQDIVDLMKYAIAKGTSGPAEAVVSMLDTVSRTDAPVFVDLVESALTSLATSERLEFYKDCSEIHRMSLDKSSPSLSQTGISIDRTLSTLLAKCFVSFMKTQLKPSASIDSEYARIRVIKLTSEKMMSTLLADAGQLHAFLQRFKLRVQMTPSWKALLTIEKGASTTAKRARKLYLLDHWQDFSEAEIASYDFKIGTNNPKRADASTAMFLALDASINQRLRTSVSIHEEDIDMCGHRLFYFIMKTLGELTSSLHRDVTQEVQNYGETLKSNSYDVATQAPALQQRIIAMRDTNGSLVNFYELIKTAMNSIPSQELKIKLAEFTFNISQNPPILNDTNDTKGTRALLLLKSSPQMVKDLIALKQWKWTPPSSDASKRKRDNDVTAFNAIETRVSSLEANVAKQYRDNSGNRQNDTRKTSKPGSKGGDPYGITPADCGGTGQFATWKQFLNWRNGHVSKDSCTYNGVVWHFCQHCNKGEGRMGNHSTANHNDNHKSRRRGRKQSTQDLPSGLKKLSVQANVGNVDLPPSKNDGEESDVPEIYNGSFDHGDE